MFPQAGGVYVYLKEAYGELFCFLYGWAYLLVIASGANAALSAACAYYYLAFIIPLNDTGIIITAVAALFIVTIINIFRVRAAEVFINTFTGLKLLGILSVIVIGLDWRKAKVHPRFRTPVNAILLQSVWAVVLLLFWGTFEDLTTYVVFTDWIYFGLAAVGIFILRRTRKDLFRPYKTLGYPVVPAIFVIITSLFILNSLIEKPVHAWAGLVLMTVALPVFFFFRKRRETIS